MQAMKQASSQVLSDIGIINKKRRAVAGGEFEQFLRLQHDRQFLELYENYQRPERDLSGMRDLSSGASAMVNAQVGSVAVRS